MTRKLPIALLLCALVVPGAGRAGDDPRLGEPGPRAARMLELLEGISKPDARIRSDRDGVQPAAEPLRAIMARHLRTRRAALDHRSYLAIVGDVLDSMGMRHIGGGSLSEAAAEEPEVRIGLGAGDLDGDGDGDAVELYARFNPENGEMLQGLVIGRDGADGSALWSRRLDTPDALIVAPGDITGDGIADVFLVELLLDEAQTEGACNGTPDVCAGVSSLRFHWRLETIAGDTGLPAWSARYGGRAMEGIVQSFAGVEQLSTVALGAVITATNAIVIPMIGGDHDGDGGLDVIVDAIDFAEVFTIGDAFSEQAGAFAFGDVVLTATKSAVLDGTNGAALYRRTMQPHPGVGFLWSPGDAVGDETPDLLWEEAAFLGPVAGCAFASDVFQCLEVGTSDVIGDMIDGATFELAWTTGPHVPGAAGFFLPLGDADGDGKDDLVLIDLAGGFTSVVLSGATGAELWRYAGFILGALGTDADGTPLVMAVEEEYDVAGVAFSLVRLDGRTGSEVGRSRHQAEVPGEWWEIFFLIEIWLLPDADADGVQDAFTQISVYAGPEVTVDTAMESGASMERLFTRHADREYFGIPVVDLDGNGTTDMIDVDPEFHRASLDLGVAGTTLPDGETLWAGEIRLFPFVFGAILPGGDLDGDGGDDVVVSLFQEAPGGFEAAIRSIAGDDGTILWQLGDLTDPPLPGTASISGTITGDGSAFPGACVNLFDTDFNYLGTEVASSSGTYTVAELNPGAYKLEFGSCSIPPFTPEWYDDQPDFESANVIEVSEGEAVTGIDADLVPFAWEE